MILRTFRRSELEDSVAEVSGSCLALLNLLTFSGVSSEGRDGVTQPLSSLSTLLEVFGTLGGVTVAAETTTSPSVSPEEGVKVLDSPCLRWTCVTRFFGHRLLLEKIGLTKLPSVPLLMLSTMLFGRSSLVRRT